MGTYREIQILSTLCKRLLVIIVISRSLSAASCLHSDVILFTRKIDRFFIKRDFYGSVIAACCCENFGCVILTTLTVSKLSLFNI
jgi:hypothetical protein